MDHIPRPPNAFMLFRQNFVHQKHVPGSIETNDNSLSKIVGKYCLIVFFFFHLGGDYGLHNPPKLKRLCAYNGDLLLISKFK